MLYPYGNKPEPQLLTEAVERTAPSLLVATVERISGAAARSRAVLGGVIFVFGDIHYASEDAH